MAATYTPADASGKVTITITVDASDLIAAKAKPGSTITVKDMIETVLDRARREFHLLSPVVQDALNEQIVKMQVEAATMNPPTKL